MYRLRELIDVLDGSGRVIRLQFTDEFGNAVTPQAVEWTLTDGSGTVINALEGVTATPAETVYVTLAGADNRYSDGPLRTLVATGVYPHNQTGSPVMIRAVARWEIIPLPI